MNLKPICFIGILWLSIVGIHAQPGKDLISQLPIYSGNVGAATDWLLNSAPYQTNIFTSAGKKDIIMSNGLVRRTFRVTPDVACTDYTNLTSGMQMIRAVGSEAIVTIDLIEYKIGGLNGQPERAYMKPEWIDGLVAGDNEFRLNDIKVSGIQPYIKWKPKRWCSNPNPPTGRTLSFFYTPKTPRLKGLTVAVHYEMYDGIPLMNKWVEVISKDAGSVVVNKVVSENLALVEEESAVVGKPEDMLKPHYLYVETNYAFNNAMNYHISDQTTHWKQDYDYTSQVNYDLGTPCILEIYPNIDPNMRLGAGQTFRSPHSFELLLDSYDRERNGLAVRRMYRTVAPWTTENPIFMHLVSRTDEQVYTAIDQCAATGYEALILSFGSHINIEDISDENIAKIRQMADYAHKRNVLIGSYSLFSSRKINPETDVISPETGKPGGAFFGNAPCLGSTWGLAYLENLKKLFTQTGLDIFENDGPYPGDVCASTSHPGHEGLHDSQWQQMELQKGFYRWCNENGIYVNAPDWYFLDGTNKIALGYREVNFSLPRDRQRILNRQNIYDGTWLKIPSMGWGFVPLTAYHGGDADAVLEPLNEHLADYEQLMMQYYGAGVQACYRGPRLYDTDETKAVVQRVVAWYKKYRNILNSDIIHLRRADGSDWDGIMHVNPLLKEKALATLYNPLPTDITRTIKLPVYYSGIHDKVAVRIQEGKPKTYKVDRDYHVEITITVPANSHTWLVME